MNSATAEEVDALKAIYGDDLECEISESNLILVRVALKGADVGTSWFSAFLEFTLDSQYPTEPPKSIALRHARGLSESEVNGCLASVKRTFDDSDSPLRRDADEKHLLYDAVENARDYLSKRSGLTLPCPICLFGFADEDPVSVTDECSHHFHPYCLARYVEHAYSEQQSNFNRPYHNETPLVIRCPVCRTVIQPDAIGNVKPQPTLWSASDSPGDACGAEFADNLATLSNPIERHFKDLYEKQKRNGGLIDLQREKDRFLVTEHTRIPNDTPPSLVPSTDT